MVRSQDSIHNIIYSDLSITAHRHLNIYTMREIMFYESDRQSLSNIMYKLNIYVL